MIIKNTRRGFTQTAMLFSVPLAGKVRHQAGKGAINKETFRNNPPSVLRTTSPAGGEGNSGFTLIELLVVVLIIAVLAAVALPQYNKAVIKSRFAEAFINLKTVSQVAQACKLEKGDDVCAQRELDIELSNNNFRYDSGTVPGAVAAQYTKEDVCICLYDSGKFVVKQYWDDTNCVSKAVSRDYAKLLNLPDADDLDEDEEGYYCTCC